MADFAAINEKYGIANCSRQMHSCAMTAQTVKLQMLQFLRTVVSFPRLSSLPTLARAMDYHMK
jgi:hypothetical protein